MCGQLVCFVGFFLLLFVYLFSSQISAIVAPTKQDKTLIIYAAFEKRKD